MTGTRDADSADTGPPTTGGGHGTLLAGSYLLSALETPNRIFREGTWDRKQIKGAGYELRLAGDLLVIPAAPGADEYERVPKGAPRVNEFELAPGDSALISTQESFSMDFDVSCTIGPKFRWSAKGILVLQGLVAHPGYGREKNSAGAWVPRENERLYLVVANIGPNPVYMRRGDPIAYVQFFDVEPAVEPKQVDNLGFDHLSNTLFGADSSNGGLAYFKNVRDVSQALAKETQERHDEETALRRLIQDEATRHTAQLDVMRAQVASAMSAVDRVRSATDNVVVFGVFLVAATILGVVATSLIGVVTKLPDDLNLWKSLVAAGVGLVYAGLTVFGVVLVAKAARRASGGDTRNTSGQTGDSTR